MQIVNEQGKPSVRLRTGDRELFKIIMRAAKSQLNYLEQQIFAMEGNKRRRRRRKKKARVTITQRKEGKK